MTKAEAWDKLVEKVNEIDIQMMLLRNGDPMHDSKHALDYRNALMDIDVLVTVYSDIVKLSEEEQKDDNI